MSKARTQTPAPSCCQEGGGQQDPPSRQRRAASTTRAAASDSGRSLRDARGSLPLTSGTACAAASPKVAKLRKEIARCWYEGYRAGRRGEPMRVKPYATGTDESWSWVGGHIEGKDRREKDAKRLADLDGTREH